MPQLNLPDHPDLSHLRRQAKALRDRVRRGDPASIDQVRHTHPGARGTAAASGTESISQPFALADAQLTLARAYGFPSWPALRLHVDEVHRLTRRPHLAPSGTGADALLRGACLDYGTSTRGDRREAERLLAADPSLSRASLAAAAATGDLVAAREILAADPTAVDREDGPFGWTPLLYLAYSRLTFSRFDSSCLDGAPGPSDARQIDHLGVARLLLAAGADPNAGFLWDGLPSPFTAVTGAFGGGEQGAPPHPQQLPLARLLLEAGASANDSQTIYNRGAGDARVQDDTEFLDLLLQGGLGRGDGGPWHRRLAPRHPAPRQLLAEALQHAAHAGLPRRARLLLDHGADPDLGSTHPLYGGRRPYEEAVLQGNPEVASQLEHAGADTSSVGDHDLLVGRLLAATEPGDAGAGAGFPAGEPADGALLSEVRRRDPDLVARAAASGRAGAIGRCLDLGFEIDARTPAGLTALHEAAVRGSTDIVELLLARGADPSLRDPQHGATPEGWAAHGGHDELAALLHDAADEEDPSPQHG